MAEWWVIPDDLQTEIYNHLSEMTGRVLGGMVRHNNENGVTGALGQTLMDNPLDTSRLRVDFDYRKFPESTEEFKTGADGAFIVTVTLSTGLTITKAALFQAKLCKSDVPPREQRLKSNDADRLKRQAGNMVKVTEDAVCLFYTPKDIYVVDAERLDQHTATVLQKPLRLPHRLITLKTYLGKWLPRCTRGDARQEFVEMADTPGGFMHLIRMDVIPRTRLLPQPVPNPLLDDALDRSSNPGKVPV